MPIKFVSQKWNRNIKLVENIHQRYFAKKKVYCSKNAWMFKSKSVKRNEFGKSENWFGCLVTSTKIGWPPTSLVTNWRYTVDHNKLTNPRTIPRSTPWRFFWSTHLSTHKWFDHQDLNWPDLSWPWPLSTYNCWLDCEKQELIVEDCYLFFISC